ncbi:peptide/nickel transport system ATP-binding protein [Gemmobacter megaterium]|uniref:Glutathione import ATP-binding protein GsiA n=1 Tax=Gemmobacter megaterium TaxID=1086013 RepID=A0A1N7QF82_9RHOB|nr:ABC transporter ATP-binding protein [Gemmobacter megaterium]GGE25854.1 glutathione ABC transporter ATP-binding protein [Gemmobacter megaterium]SIT21520.1 peptide/nickel transport system ATP-binding protein [Gemmobacter megaterium]
MITMQTADPHSAPVLEVQGLRTEFLMGRRWNAAVQDLSMTIHRNETVAVVGESGSGKSVTALSVMGLLPAQGARIAAGRILFEGQDLARLPEPQMARIRGQRMAMIFQEPMTSLNPTMTVGEQIGESLVIHHGASMQEARRQALRLLERVRIPAAARRVDEFPHQFSGGMRQRAMIAMALACRPQLLIADEPTTALDVTIQAQILQLIKELQQEEGMGVLFITHDMGVVAEIADRALVMRHGHIVEDGRCTDIFARPRHPYTRTLLSAVPQLGAMGDSSQPMPFPDLDEDGRERPAPPVASRLPDQGAPLLQVRGLTTRFDIRGGFLRRVQGRVHAVEDVSFDLRAGETLALVGESGCGKSTTGRSVLRLLEPVAGEVVFDGRKLSDLSKAELKTGRRQMQMIFQDPFASLDPRQRVGDAIAEPLQVHRLVSRADLPGRVAALLGRVGLDPGMAERYPHEFSGGQRQRICIARALAMEPKLIVADESVSALDVSIKAQIVNLMLELQAGLGLSYLFISHDMAVVERISHRVAVMYLGEIVEIGPRARIFGNPQHPYTRKLLSAVLLPDPSRRRMRRTLSNDEIPSPIRPADHIPARRSYREAGEDHWVMQDA